MKPTLAISIGDINGIGPEIILKTLFSDKERPYEVLLLGHEAVLVYYARQLFIENPEFLLIDDISQMQHSRVNLLTVDELTQEDIKPGKVTQKAGSLAMKAVSKGIELCLSGEVNSLVTAPISKEAIHLAGYDVPGHTEFLAKKTQCSDYVMMLVSKTLRVGLVSTHIPIHKVAQHVTMASILKQLRTMDQSLRTNFGITDPKIAVLGLNPHAGDGGVLGQEEINIITPALLKANESGIYAEGPFPADGFFGSRSFEKYDAVLAMYHDQGLIPFKTLAFNAGVNFTAGLPIIRTSPDHGTAFSIAGKGIANTRSFQEAIQLATQLGKKKLGSRFPLQ